MPNGIEVFTSALPFGNNGNKQYVIIRWEAPNWAVSGTTKYIVEITTFGQLPPPYGSPDRSNRSWQETIDLHKAVLNDPDAFHVTPHITSNTYIYALLPKEVFYNIKVRGTNDLDMAGDVVCEPTHGIISVTSPVISIDYLATGD